MSNYNLISYYSPEDKAYIVHVPELPGCFADGKTKEEALFNIERVIEEWITTAQELGRDIPEPHTDLIDRSNISIRDVAYHILQKTDNISTLMLQKLTYYSQAWSLAWTGVPLFEDRFEAWEKGPVNPKIFYTFQGRRIAPKNWVSSDNELNNNEKFIVDSVLSVYSDLDPDWLSKLTHIEDPWKIARGDIPLNCRCSEEITKQSMAKYYQSLIS